MRNVRNESLTHMAIAAFDILIQQITDSLHTNRVRSFVSVLIYARDFIGRKTDFLYSCNMKYVISMHLIRWVC